MKEKKYIVSADIHLLLKRWAEEKGLSLPSDEFFEKLRIEFCNHMEVMFSNFDFVTEEELCEGLSQIVQNTDIDIVSLERVYLKPNIFLDISRTVCLNAENNQITDAGLKSRHGSSSISDQLMHIKESGLSEIALLDDVIFSGDMLEKVIKELSNMGIKVPIVIAGIAISKGVDRLKKLGVEVRYVRFYEDIIDEVCERDFYPGILYSGRSIAGDANCGIPYILPYVEPGEWASIPPAKGLNFSIFCLQQTIALFEAIEDVNGKEIKCSDLGRQIVRPWDGRVVDKLKKDLYILVSEWRGGDTGS